jgi:hypothetical protein
MTGTSFPHGIRVGADDVLLSAWNHVALDAATFVGGTTNARGDHDGTGDPTTLFTVTGDVMVMAWAECTTDLVGASAVIEVGITGDTAVIIAQTTATDIDDGDVWNGATPGAGIAALSPIVVLGGADIIETIGTANITAGVLVYHCLWTPISADGAVVAA